VSVSVETDAETNGENKSVPGFHHLYTLTLTALLVPESVSTLTV
jgi:hypothetical protein